MVHTKTCDMPINDCLCINFKSLILIFIGIFIDQYDLHHKVLWVLCFMDTNFLNPLGLIIMKLQQKCAIKPM